MFVNRRFPKAECYLSSVFIGNYCNKLNVSLAIFELTKYVILMCVHNHLLAGLVEILFSPGILIKISFI